VHCRIYEPRTNPSAGWYSKKFSKAGLSYEIAIDIYTSQIIWINGPFPAGHNDILIFTKALKDKIPDGRRAIGDEGYRGYPEKIRTRNKYDTPEMKRFRERVKARYQTFNWKLKQFSIFEERFRSKGETRLEKHKAAFEAAAVVAQYEMDNGHPLFDV